MIPYERRQKMLQLLAQQEVVQLGDFLEKLENVSESTVRRDLKTLEAEGKISMLRGGGATLCQNSYEAPVHSKSIQNVDAKELIARHAASYVKEGETIYLDAGSTTLRMVPHLKGKHVTIITTNALILRAIQEAEVSEQDIKCIVVGGDLLYRTASLVGMATNSQLQKYFFDRAFIGISGVSALAGFTTPDDREASKKLIVRKNSRKSYILADSSKLGVTTLCHVFKVGDIPLITDVEDANLQEYGNYIVAK